VPLKILLADDSLTAQNMAKKILADAGYEVIAVSNGAQAMKKIVSEKPDLVVLDVYMPGYSGLELCERMRNSRETATTPVVLSVGKMEAFKPEDGTRVRADGLIVKPFEATELLAVVKRLAENVSAASRPQRSPEPASVPEVGEPTSAAVESAEPEFGIQHRSIEIPQEFASTPAIGMEHIPEEMRGPVAPIEFEVERDPAPVELDASPRMASAAGLSGVFEMEAGAPAAVEGPAEPVPVEEFQRFAAPVEAPAAAQQAHEPAADLDGTTVEHGFPVESPEAFGGEVELDSHTGSVAETWSAPPADTKQVQYPVERFDHAQAEASVENMTPQSPEILPELASWEEPLRVSAGETPHLSPDPVLDHSAAELAVVELAPPGPVWVAEEAEIEPHESATPLHQQMKQEALVSETSEAAASPTGSVQTSLQSRETGEPFGSGQHQSLAEISGFDEAAILSEWEPAPPPAPVEPPEIHSVDPGLAGSSFDLPANFTAASEAQPAAEPAPEVAGSAADAAAELLPQTALPRVTEVPVDPARIAHIVDEVLERLKPELIAAVTRELERKNQ
jgi:DNA-binding response OmpR family regulator